MKTEFTSEQLADPRVAVCAQAIRKCVHCGFCNATCPTYVLLGDERDSPRGRIYLMKQMLEEGKTPTPEVVQHIDRCLSCLSCTSTCPSGVDYMHLIDHSRAYVEKHFRRPLPERLVRWALAHILPFRERMRVALRLGRIASPAAAWLRHVNSAAPFATMLRLAGSISLTSPAPIDDSPAVGTRRGHVLLMQGCAESVLRPQIRAATVRLLNRVGYDVTFARDEECCGALLHHMGREQQAAAQIRRNIDVWTRAFEMVVARGAVDAIVITTSGCGTVIKDYGFILRHDREYAARAARIAALAKDVSELLAPADIRSRVRGMSGRVAYHPACSLQHGQKIVSQPKQLLEAAGFEVLTAFDSHLCCGSAGVYNILQPHIAAQLGQRKTAQLAALDPDVIATGNVGCAVQICVSSKIPVVHTIELLDWATGGPKPNALEACAAFSEEQLRRRRRDLSA